MQLFIVHILTLNIIIVLCVINIRSFRYFIIVFPFNTIYTSQKTVLSSHHYSKMQL